MNFEYMTSSQIAALILGIVFSIIAVATTFLAFKYAKKFNSFVKAISMALVAPFLAMIAWLFLIFSFLDGFRKDEVLNIIISILIALFICCMIILIAKALYNKNKDKFIEEDEDEEPVDDSLETIGDENEEAPVQGETLLLTDATKKEIENTETDNVVDSEEVVDEKESENISKELNTEETEVDDKEEIAENNETSEKDDNSETEDTEDVAKQEENNDDIVETTEEDINKETNETDEKSDENVSTEVSEDNDDTDDDDDKEFQEFLDSLRKKIDSEDNDSNK